MEKVDAVTARRRDPRNYVFGFGRRCVFPQSGPREFPHESDWQFLQAVSRRASDRVVGVAAHGDHARDA